MERSIFDHPYIRRHANIGRNTLARRIHSKLVQHQVFGQDWKPYSDHVAQLEHQICSEAKSPVEYFCMMTEELAEVHLDFEEKTDDDWRCTFVQPQRKAALQSYFDGIRAKLNLPAKVKEQIKIRIIKLETVMYKNAKTKDEYLTLLEGKKNETIQQLFPTFGKKEHTPMQT